MDIEFNVNNIDTKMYESCKSYLDGKTKRIEITEESMKKLFEDQIGETEDDLRRCVNSYGFSIRICPNCGKYTLDTDFICSNCKFESGFDDFTVINYYEDKYLNAKPTTV